MDICFQLDIRQAANQHRYRNRNKIYQHSFFLNLHEQLRDLIFFALESINHVGFDYCGFSGDHESEP